MSSNPVQELSIELDLAFTAAPEDLLKEGFNPTTRLLLTSEVTWEKNLKKWIQFVRSDKKLKCHEIIRLIPSISLGLQFTDDATIKKLNSSWRNKEETTDVLSFPAIDPKFSMTDNNCLELGDIIVSASTAHRQAQEHKHGMDKEIRWLVSHGLLHLMGWEHSNEESLNEMLSFQERLLNLDVNVLPCG